MFLEEIKRVSLDICLFGNILYEVLKEMVEKGFFGGILEFIRYMKCEYV